jgi:hypothetical protein
MLKAKTFAAHLAAAASRKNFFDEHLGNLRR